MINDKSQPVARASVKIKNTLDGAITDEQGKFSLPAPTLPVTLEISSVGFETEEITVTTTTEVTVILQSYTKMLNPVVMGGTRTSGKLISTPVSIEIAGKADFNNSPTDPYSTILSKKSLDVTVSSITYKTYSTRGFNGSGSSRVN
ncbi:MAG: carboxypeptidase-like regulatory domain-containing protein, partial [Bacteroidia bacterium]|nr:carboxypeptidase-like regulatory domain-containing protein [Bacteroidia bacterium]